jgi:hypothetical protein
VTDLETRQSRLVVQGAGCFMAIWTPDSSQLLVHVGSTCRLVTVATGASTAFGGDRDCGYVAFSPGGAYRAWYPSVETSAGVVVHALPATLPGGPEGIPVEAFGVTDDGRYVSMGLGNTDPGRSRGGGWLYDTATGTFLDEAALLGPDQDGERLYSVSFLPGGGLMVSTYSETTATHRWHLLSGIGTVTATLADAPGFIGVGEFAYQP